MARPVNVQSHTLSGRLPGGDRWATTVWTSNGAPSQFGPDSATVLATGGAFETFADELVKIMGNGSTFDTYTLRAYGASSEGSVVTSTAPVNRQGSSQFSLPNQIALVATIRTAVANATGRGRMFLPCTGAQIAQASGKVTSINTQNLVNALAAWLGAIGAGVVSVKAGQFRPATRAEIGDVADTMRARRDRLVENRIGAAISS